MKNRVQDIFRIVPPPPTPVRAPTQQRFSDVERQLNQGLPDDFKQLLSAYGAGRWQEFYVLLNPSNDSTIEQWTSPDGDESTRTELGLMRSVRSEDRLYDTDDVPYSIFPEENGILPWAQTENRGCLFWITCGNPSRWRTVYYEDDERSERQEYDLSCSEIIYGALTGELRIFDSDHEGDQLPNTTNSTAASLFESANAG